MKKNLKINCATCDARNLTEDVLSAYEKVKINCANVVVSPASQALLSRYGASLNCAGITVVPEDVQLSTVNGSHKITPNDVPAGRTYLMVNGFVEIAPGSEKVLESYVGISINGCLTCPESLCGHLPNLTINGPTTFYPDEAIVLKSTAVIDRLFALRAKNKLYWSERRMVLVDPKLDGAVLAEKGARFSSQEVIVAESLAEAVLPLIDEQAQIILVPDGTAVIRDDAELTDATVKRYGTKLYITGSLEVSPEAGQVLEALEYLKVLGDVTVPEQLRDLLLEKAEIEGKVTVRTPFRGREVCDVPNLRITKWMLEHEKDGLVARDCAAVKLDADIPNELILERLQLVDCAGIRCSSEQEGAVTLICQDCANISTGDTAEKPDPEEENTVKINAANYTF